MLNNLKIQNFRLLENLEIEQLGQVNLIVGKNNMGKSTLLEALRIYASLGSPHLLEKLLDSHDETVDIRPTEGILPVENFFTGMSQQEIYIGNVEKTSYVSMKPVYFIFEEQADGDLTVRRIRKEIDKTDISIYPGVRQTLKIRYKNDRLEQALMRSRFNKPPEMWLDFLSYDRNDYAYIQLQKMGATFPYGYVSTDVIPSSDLSGTWDNFSLTHRQQMIEGLKLIDPSIEDLGFKEKRNSVRVPIVKKQGQDKTEPLKSSGDGILRILQLILSMMQAKDGFLFIDEFENGLHYSVQAQVWEFIFKLAKELNVQVFATTHSWDCVTAFQEVSQDKEAEAILFRLGRSARKSHQGQIIALVYDKQRLQKVTQAELEVR